MGLLKLINKPALNPNSPPPPPKKSYEKLFLLEKIKLFFIILSAVTIPIISTYYITSNSYNKQLIEIQHKLNYMNHPSFKMLEKLEETLIFNISHYNKEIEELKKDPVYSEVNKKIEKLDNEIIKCTVHINKINSLKSSKSSNSKEIEEYLNSIVTEFKIK